MSVDEATGFVFCGLLQAPFLILKKKKRAYNIKMHLLSSFFGGESVS